MMFLAVRSFRALSTAGRNPAVGAPRGLRNLLRFLFLFSLTAVVSWAADGDLPASVGTPLKAANDSELTTALSKSAAGQHIVLTGTSYSAARTLGAGKVITSADLAKMPVITGVYTLSGNGAIVHGLYFSGAGRVVISGDRAQVLRSKLQGQTDIPITVNGGTGVIIARNELSSWGKNTEGGARRGISVKAPRQDGTDGASQLTICYNYIHDQLGYNPETVETDAEVIALGQTGSGGRSQSKLEAWVHHNLIVNCAGDNEGFGVKSSYNKIEYNHLIGVRGFNNRTGGYNTYIGNRLEKIVGSGARLNRGGYKNRSLGEVIDGNIRIEGGNYNFGETHQSYMRSDSTEVIGTTAKGFIIGVDEWNKWNLNAVNTLIEATNVAPTLGNEQSNTRNRWSTTASVSVPTAIRVASADVGPLSDRSTTVDPLEPLAPTNLRIAQP